MVNVFAGGFGSGKTEISLNLALRQAADKPVLADLDLVNPYFCSREMEQLLTENGITFIGPRSDLKLSDVPHVPASIIGFLKSERSMIIDVGGDEVGCWVLGYLSQYIKVRNYQMFLVLNPYRPFSDTAERVKELRSALEGASRLQFSAVVSNPNFSAATDLNSVLEGHELNKSFAEAIGLPIEFLAVEERFCREVEGVVQEKVMPVKILLRPDWV